LLEKARKKRIQGGIVYAQERLPANLSLKAERSEVYLLRLNAY
jgi:hypothetical protein